MFPSVTKNITNGLGLVAANLIFNFIKIGTCYHVSTIPSNGKAGQPAGAEKNLPKFSGGET